MDPGIRRDDEQTRAGPMQGHFNACMRTPGQDPVPSFQRTLEPILTLALRSRGHGSKGKRDPAFARMTSKHATAASRRGAPSARFQDRDPSFPA